MTDKPKSVSQTPPNCNHEYSEHCPMLLAALRAAEEEREGERMASDAVIRLKNEQLAAVTRDLDTARLRIKELWDAALAGASATDSGAWKCPCAGICDDDDPPVDAPAPVDAGEREGK